VRWRPKLMKKEYGIISSPHESAARKVLKDLKNKKFCWVYLGENVSNAINLEREIGDNGQRYEISKDLQKTAEFLRQPYIDYMGKLNIKNNSPRWWSGRISEKNPFVSRVFLYTCYVRIFQSLIKSNDRKKYFVFFVENKSLRICLLSNSCCKIRLIEPLFTEILKDLKELFDMVLKKGIFLKTNLSSIYKFKLNRLPTLNVSKDTVLIQTWLTKNSFKDNKYYDIYFGDLAYYLKSKGKNVVIVPFPSPDDETIQKIMHNNEQFLIPEAFTSVSDVLKVVINSLLQIPRKKRYPLLKEIDISEILYDEQKKDWMDTSKERILILNEMIKNWKEQGMKIDMFICPFENLRHEKILYTALREFYPSIYIIGYQHATVPLMMLNYFISAEEADKIPLPNKIITNGNLSKRIFSNSGYNPKKLVCGGAIRYTYLFENDVAEIKNLEPQILVTPSIGIHESAELIWKVFNAFKNASNYKVVIKCHPFTPYNTIAKYLGIGSLPAHFIVSEKSIDELLKESSILLYTSSTVAIEAIARGVQVLHIPSEFTIDMDPLDLHPQVKISTSSLTDINKNVDEILSGTMEIEKKMRDKVVSDFFGPVNKKMFSLFKRK